MLFWRQVAAALAKSSTISAQLLHATSVDDQTLGTVQRRDSVSSLSAQLLHATSVDDETLGTIQRRDSVSSISSDEFHDAESGDEMANSE
eukprot:COSAG02_NODE_5143_length_4594_cov_5.994438_4_plen_90_part_00